MASRAACFRTIPGLEHAVFARLGGLHRNTFLNSPKLLGRAACGSMPIRACALQDRSPASRATWNWRPSACWPAGSPRAEIHGREPAPPPQTTALGALLAHITGGHLAQESGGVLRSFQPMNVNFGLFPPLAPDAGTAGKRLKGAERGLARKKSLSARALSDLSQWLSATAGHSSTFHAA